MCLCVLIVSPGKSTVIKLITRMLDVDSGDILLDGANIAHVTKESIRRRVAVVPQDTCLFDETVGYNIKYGNPEATDEEVREVVQLANLQDTVLKLPQVPNHSATIPDQHGCMFCCAMQSFTHLCCFSLQACFCPAPICFSLFNAVFVLLITLAGAGHRGGRARRPSLWRRAAEGLNCEVRVFHFPLLIAVLCHRKSMPAKLEVAVNWCTASVTV